MTGGFEGFEEVNQRFKVLMQNVRADVSERAVTQILIAAGGYAAAMTPVATSTLLNSQYRKVEVTVEGVTGEIGYGADYAIYVHEAPGTLLGTNTPRYPKSDGFVWGPGAEPGFLAKGVAMMVSEDAQRILKSNYAL